MNRVSPVRLAIATTVTFLLLDVVGAVAVIVVALPAGVVLAFVDDVLPSGPRAHDNPLRGSNRRTARATGRSLTIPRWQGSGCVREALEERP